MDQISDKPIDFFSALIDQGKQIYAILDAASKPEIPKQLWRFNAEYTSLYKDEPEEKYDDVAPYLVNLSGDGGKPGALMEWVFEECWGGGNAIFFEANADSHSLLAHFQRFTLVVNEAGKGMLFRFYDPRVLRVYLPTCTPEELKYIFGPDIHAFFMENEDGGPVSVFSPKEEILLKSIVAPPPILVIRKEQMALFQSHALEQFIIKSISFLKKNFLVWSLHRSDEAIRLFVEETIRFGGGYNIRKQINLQKIMHYQIEYSFEIPLSGYLQERLAGKDLNETQRVERFYFGLIKNQHLVEMRLE